MSSSSSIGYRLRYQTSKWGLHFRSSHSGWHPTVPLTLNLKLQNRKVSKLRFFGVEASDIESQFKDSNPPKLNPDPNPNSNTPHFATVELFQDRGEVVQSAEETFDGFLKLHGEACWRDTWRFTKLAVHSWGPYFKGILLLWGLYKGPCVRMGTAS